jgi:uncharacterized protein YjbI with pentapeptide repeats
MITAEQLQSHANWLRDRSGIKLECVNANLSGADLSGADLRCANLSGANLRCANLRCANLSGANLSGANLSGADLRCASLRCANLRGANLRHAVGNMREIRSAHFETWPVVWSSDILAIGCQQHSIEKWRNADPGWIAAMDLNATYWWSRYGASVLQLIDASAATGVVLNQ